MVSLNRNGVVSFTEISTFSFDDFFTFSKFLASNKIANKNTFNFGVTTKYGTYTLILNNWNKFNTYLQSTINNLQGSIDLFQKFDAQSTGIHELNSGAVNEANLLNILKDSGVSLLKKDPTSGTFKVLMIDANGNVTIVNCSGTMGIE